MVNAIPVMKKILILISFFLVLGSTYAQYDLSKINKKATQLYEQAMERIDDGHFASAAGLLQQAIDADKNYIEAYLSLGAIYGKLKSYKSSTASFEKAFLLDSVYTLDFKVNYSIQLAGLGEFQKALDAVNELLTKKPPKNQTALESALKRKRSWEFALEYARNNPDKNYVFAPQNAGENVNTAESEYFPSMTIDGKELVFTRRLKNINEDFYQSKLEGGRWTVAKPIEGDINTPMSEAAQNISSDGQWLVFTANNRQPGFGNYDLYISFMTPTGWDEPTNLGNRINTDQWDAQPCLSPDKRDLYFASRRMGGMGGKDIYVSHMLPTGQWSSPENMGPSINTTGDDECPFIHADNQTLYFVSNGQPGYGGDDLFVTRKKPGGSWEKAKNLGYPINTISDEGTLFVTAEGTTAYYASDRNDTKGGHDIYSFELRKDIRPNKTVWVKGTIIDKKTKAGLSSSVELVELATKQTITKVQTDETGNYLITLPLGKDYAFSVNKKGYLFYSENFPMTDRLPDSTYEKNIFLQPIETNATIVLKNIFFDVNKFELQPTSQAELEKLVQLLIENPALRIEISGHTDNVGKPADNLLLSINRAKAVVTYLVSKGITIQRLTSKGYGETKPISGNKTDEQRGLNRRTEMKVLGQ